MDGQRSEDGDDIQDRGPQLNQAAVLTRRRISRAQHQSYLPGPQVHTRSAAPCAFSLCHTCYFRRFAAHLPVAAAAQLRSDIQAADRGDLLRRRRREEGGDDQGAGPVRTGSGRLQSLSSCTRTTRYSEDFWADLSE
ncbi:hypothetical protein F2P81_023968 [Scophthalmus maximus]|uniref:Uncharacterized protein n=1 Tax=Scophthalmus maximus TaxID=52904 RepID=A0A6A4RTG1_SCOMX|nr:hypothetical protein F2P81_023968 [Scophthalmus maximus]